MIDARIGQGRFRESVLARWGNRCAVTACDIPLLVRASHILPWRNASNEQRLNAENGLPLIATLDAMFDAGLVSFTNAGEMLIGERLRYAEHLYVGSLTALRQDPTARMKRDLAMHRREFGFDS